LVVRSQGAPLQGKKGKREMAMQAPTGMVLDEALRASQSSTAITSANGVPVHVHRFRLNDLPYYTAHTIIDRDKLTGEYILDDGMSGALADLEYWLEVFAGCPSRKAARILFEQPVWEPEAMRPDARVRTVRIPGLVVTV
jgi:hypothetical protein